MELTRVERQIIKAVQDAGGRRRSLFALALELGISYANAHHRISILEMLGLLVVERNGNKPLMISFTCEDDDQLQPPTPPNLY